MATTVQVKPQALKNIGNVPEWVNKQRVKDKKEGAPLKPRRSLKAKVSTVPQVTPVVYKPSVIPQPITEEVKDPIDIKLEGSAGSKVRRIYSREFLIKFKYSASPFPIGTPTPQDIIAQYNKDFELRERMAQENSSLTAGKPAVSVHSAVPQPEQAAAEAPRVPTEKKIIKKKTTEGEKKAFKLRGLETADESILRSPLFRASANKISGAKRSASPFQHNDDKENPTVPSKAVRSTSVTKTQRAASPLVKGEAKTQKLPTTSSSLIPAAPAVVSVPTSTPAPIIPTHVPVEIKQETISIPLLPTPEPVAAKIETEDKQDALDVLTKKLKSVLKETDPRRLAQRQKQIEYGKATLGYKDYTKEIAKSKRKREDPKTPNKYQVCSKRSWDGQIRKWRRMLHFYDPADLQGSASGNPDLEMELDSKLPSMQITAADILAEENALLE